MKFFSRTITLLLAGVALNAAAEAPAGYYSACENKSGTALLSALFSTITNHTNVGYDGLWTLYKTSDVRPNGKIWDMYSTKEWTPGQAQCGQYKLVGDCYNREHSLPKSWFKEAQPMKSDAYHVYPTDGKVNGQRSNYPFGECAGGTRLAGSNGVEALGRLGKSTYPGYSGTVFEPDDQYKGDFARSYFYMAACYYDRIGNWSSDMLSGDKNNPFKSWAIEMLLKWHRQDPVSEKEINRNEAVYAAQHNRNPFIDHPELAEYIWGNRKGTSWTSSATAEPTIHQPQNGTEINLGITRPGTPVSRSITIHTSQATANVAVTVIGGGFSVSSRSISAANANAGTAIILTYDPAAVGEHAATLRVVNAEAVSTVTIRGRAVEGLPAGPATDVTDESFVATWVFVGDADATGCYTLSVADHAGTLEGYPKAVNAAAGSFKVDGLMPSTAYTYTVASTKETSETVNVSTGDPVPAIDFLFDGTLAFETAPGQPSEIAELVVETDNIEGDYSVHVDAPFQISLDKSLWLTTITMTPDDDRLYMRLFTNDPGEYSTSITATYGSFVSDDATARGIATSEAAFLEDFEKSVKSDYNGGNYDGTATSWTFHDAGVYSGNSEPVVSGKNSVRFGKSADSYIAMNTDLSGGVGTISFQAAKWKNDANATLAVETSVDGGKTYTPAGTVSVTDNTFKPFNVFAGVAGKARVRLRQTAGSRLNLDDIAISSHTSGCEYLEADYHAWDAFGRDGALVVEVNRTLDAPVAIYALDGTTILDAVLAPGTHTFTLAPGLYIVACADHARRVLLR